MDVGDIIGGIAKTALGVVTGGLSDRVMGLIEDVVPGGLSPEQRALLKGKIEEETTKRERAAHKAASQAEQNVTHRIKELEGTASDLKAIPIIGTLIIFLRGCQRPTWGFATLYMDFMVFSKKWPLVPDSMQEMAFWTINFLVLGFLFGERAIKNVMPVITAFMAQRRA